MQRVLDLRNNKGITDDNIFRIVLVLLLSLSFIVPNHLHIIAAVLGILLFFFILYHPIRIAFLIIIYISLLPIEEWGQRYDLYQFYVNIPLLQILFIFLVLNSLLFFINKDPQAFSCKISPIGLNLILLFAFIILAILRGFINANDSVQIVNELFFLSLYLVYFVFLISMINKNQLNTIWQLIFILTIVIGLQYLLILRGHPSFSILSLERISTRQAHLAPFAVPYILYSLFRPGTWHKIFAIIFSVPVFFVILASQQRALWIAIFGVIILMALLENIHPKRKINISIFIKFAVVTIFILSALIGISLIVFNAKIVLLQRIQTLFLLEQDISATQRLAEIKNALKLWQEAKFFGTGLGDIVVRIQRYGGTSTVDNSYIYYLWKVGFFGLTLFVSLWIMVLYHGVKALKMTSNWFERRLLITVVSGLSGVLVIAFTNSCMVNYRFNFVWGIAIYTIDKIFRDIKTNETS